MHFSEILAEEGILEKKKGLRCYLTILQINVMKKNYLTI